ncbi:TetR/AcrR family transcriptional regulator [Leptospira wolffii]|uniref:AcrR family transcriptional regulator n=1 Tax=Leptospira wolffii TaxID=409998 RepID=A0A2M9ZEZ0_9LEPT|nr:TetR/AcrR family transcriptional regulator [Leptospira wolffii]PJZ67020.1 AcrR family transcriptional regulator [Leptospira wolffii]TGK61994.1 TetR/AcrR family transcriptional regulator [Leptospira wolffii]TGK68595.1 TetR/AcrR family transcriptional regulator [Leptospira wolffii]TGK74621.1 TetR/AcrR family transcriptional regulator [Leptospira wolffii]TGL31803.1 TetR/AcrR family transcriptional regulator [Leptospira wolffii]
MSKAAKKRSFSASQPNDKSSELNLRKSPSQKRAIERVQYILDVVADLLDEVGTEGINTNLIAQRAEVPIGSLYQYFPNKHAILKAVGQRHLERVNAMILEFIKDKPDISHWEELTDMIIDAFAQLYKSEPGFIPLWSNKNLDPELVKIDRANNRMIADFVSDLFFGVIPWMKEKEEMTVMSRIIVEVTDSVLSRWLRESEDQILADGILQELKVILKAYMKHYIVQGKR